jgi:hypothetical protein
MARDSVLESLYAQTAKPGVSLATMKTAASVGRNPAIDAPITHSVVGMLPCFPLLYHPLIRKHRESSSSGGPKKRRESRSTLRDQLAQLQEKVDELIQGQNTDTLMSSDTRELSSDSLQTASPRMLVGDASHKSPESLVNCSTYASSVNPCHSERTFQETDIFYAQNPSPNSIALSSQIDMLRRLGC